MNEEGRYIYKLISLGLWETAGFMCSKTYQDLDLKRNKERIVEIRWTKIAPFVMGKSTRKYMSSHMTIKLPNGEL